MGDEFARIAAIAATLGDRASGLGDDCAVVEGWVVTVDACVEGVHFHERARTLSLEDLGYRATVAAASDVLAMGGEPVFVVAAWTLPPWLDDEGVRAIARGQRQACEALDAKVVGGNLASGPVLSLTTTVLGRAAAPVRREGARVGDKVVVIGALGEAALGRAAIERGDEEHRCIRAWRRPPVLRREALTLAKTATAMIDVSDGLAQDLGHLAAASGVGVELDLAALLDRVHPEARALAGALGSDLAQAVLGGGEDYALVATVTDVPDGAEVIGRCVAGAGVVVVSAGERAAGPAGFVHGATP